MSVIELSWTAKKATFLFFFAAVGLIGSTPPSASDLVAGNSRLCRPLCSEGGQQPSWRGGA